MFVYLVLCCVDSIFCVLGLIGFLVLTVAFGVWLKLWLSACGTLPGFPQCISAPCGVLGICIQHKKKKYPNKED